jgi:hypothetical protein
VAAVRPAAASSRKSAPAAPTIVPAASASRYGSNTSLVAAQASWRTERAD